MRGSRADLVFPLVVPVANVVISILEAMSVFEYFVVDADMTEMLFFINKILTPYKNLK